MSPPTKPSTLCNREECVGEARPEFRVKADDVLGYCSAECRATCEGNGNVVQALLAFVTTVNLTGGVCRQGNKGYAPATDEEWSDLGDAYMDACAALGVDPKTSESEFSGNEDEEEEA